MKDYSQGGEQAIITRYLQGKPAGRLLDIGSNDGELLSNSRALMLSGWHGVLVEPSPAAFEKLCELYGAPGLGALSEVKLAGVTLVRAAITSTNGPVDFYDSGTHLKKGDVALLSTTVPQEMDRWKKSGEQFTKTSVRGITFETLMKETGVSQFSFISIDAEGMDLLILNQIDLAAVGCQLLCIEYNNSKKTEWAIEQQCAKFGMKLLHRTYENLLLGR